MSILDPTYVGQVASVTGGVIGVRLRQDIGTTLVMVGGESYRVGQIGAFFRIPLGFTQLYAICSKVGAAASPNFRDLEDDPLLKHTTDGDEPLAGYRWMTIVLFGESVGKYFDRGVGQYPTIGDEVHFVTTPDLKIIYGRGGTEKSITIGAIASASGIPAQLNLEKMVTRHTAVVGSTGAGKSNLVSVILEAIASKEFPAARVLVIDPHGEYTNVGGDRARVFRVEPEKDEYKLRIPFWALPFDELKAITLGDMQPAHEATIRDIVVGLKREAAKALKSPPSQESITADSPIPFSLKQLWFVLDDHERQTFRRVGNVPTVTKLQKAGSAELLTSNKYEDYGAAGAEPNKNPAARNIQKQLELLRSRLTDDSLTFLFDPGDGFTPDLDGKTANDLDSLVASWVGHDRPLSIIDVSGLPAEISAAIVGLLIRIVYDFLFWARDLDVGGRKQPLFIVLDEAHKILPNKATSPAHRTFSRIAKEGRKYGVGLMVVTQRPSEIDETVLSQCGTMIALRITNGPDQQRVASSFPDDLAGLTELLPSLRTGEGLFMGEAMFVPSHVRVRLTNSVSAGGDPNVIEAWKKNNRPDAKQYSQALKNWRQQGKAK